MQIKLFILALLLPFIASAQQKITVNGTQRSMLVYAPSGLENNRPLLISLHGMGQSAEYQQGMAKWEEVADTAKFVVVYPSTVGTTWDISGTSDLDFIEAIINEMSNKYSIDLKRVYLSGFSMGGMMTYHAANNLADKIAAFAPVSGYMTEDHNSSRAIPLIHTHGTADDVVPCEAGNSGSTGAFFPGCQAIAEGWADRNNCDATPVSTTPYPVGTSNTNVKKVWKNGDCDTEVALIKITGKGHWHSNDPAGVHTTREIWNFIRRFSLDCGQLSNFSVSFTAPEEGTGYVAPATVPVDVEYTEGATIDHLDFFLDDETTAFHSEYQAPYNFDWTDVAAGTYSLKVVAYDSEGNTAENTISVTVNVPQAPYGASPQAIPGTVDLANYDVGGNGFAYYDISAGNEGGADYRLDEDVDIETCTDAGSGYNIGFAQAGEWTEYTVKVEKSGVYTLSLRAASDGADKTVSLSMDGKNLATDIEIPNTEGWQAWEDVIIENIQLEAGEQVLRLTIGDANYVNLNTLSFTLEEEPVAIQLTKGWNLIGYPFNGSEAVQDALSSIISNLTYVKDADGFYSASGEAELNTLTELQYGRGYFVKVDADCELTW